MKLVVVESPAKCQKIQSYLGPGYIVKASYGHFRDLDKKNMGIDVNNNYEPNYIIIPEKKKVVTDLKTAYKKSDKKIIISSDLDNEGEAIAFHLREVLKCGDNYDRIVFNEITKNAIINAIDNPTKININKFHAQQIIKKVKVYQLVVCNQL